MQTKMYMRFVHTYIPAPVECVCSCCLCCHILSGKIIAQIFLLLNILAKLQFTLHCKMQNARKKVCRLQQQHKYVCMYARTNINVRPCSLSLLVFALPFVYKEVYFVQLPSCSFVLSSSTSALSTLDASFVVFSIQFSLATRVMKLCKSGYNC